jgi:hypothetical protein
MLRSVALVGTYVSEELGASFIRATRIGELGATPAVTSNRLFVTLIKGALRSSETSVLKRATRSGIPEDAILHGHRHEGLKSYKYFYCCVYLLEGRHVSGVHSPAPIRAEMIMIHDLCYRDVLRCQGYTYRDDRPHSVVDFGGHTYGLHGDLIGLRLCFQINES